MGLLGACGKADCDNGLDCRRSVDELPLGAGAAAGGKGVGWLRNGRHWVHHDGLSRAISRSTFARLLLWGRATRLLPERVSGLQQPADHSYGVFAQYSDIRPEQAQE